MARAARKLDRNLRFEPERLPQSDYRHIRLAIGQRLRPAGDALMTVSYTQGLEISVLGAVDRARSAIKDYRTHSDVARLLVETAREIAVSQEQ